ncbi:Uncharacterised protein [Mycobacteroides abscessus subsp. abscessus]|nr:Uncharacterised protein [Mycobacteroides abscessus subsp. abscessus]SKR87145.1 Uncharacterised protein [Mycobacteroides abscessus subsp. abscessus]
MFPAFEDLGDRPAGGDESGGDDEDRDEDEEDHAVGHHGRRSHAQEDRNVDADVVPAIGERDCCDGPDTDVLAGHLAIVVIVIVIVATPGSPCRPQSQGQGYEPEVGDDVGGKERSGAQRDEHRRAQNPGESQVLACGDPSRCPALSRAAGEEQRQHDDVVDVGDDEQADRGQNGRHDHGAAPVSAVSRARPRAATPVWPAVTTACPPAPRGWGWLPDRPVRPGFWCARPAHRWR